MNSNINNFTLPENPYTLFSEWLDLANKSEINDAGAMCLATVSPDGRPANRMVLLKEVDLKGFKFHTNGESRKADHINNNPHAALCFHWKSLRKQVRGEGAMREASREEAAEYFHTRSKESQIGAWASQQSRDLENYQELQDTYAHYQEKFKGEDVIPKPDYWTGYRLEPDMFEFWQDGEHRLHQRHVYLPDGNGGWTIKMINP